MGIVRLVENKDEGRYAVEIVKDIERAKAAKDKLIDAINKLKIDIKEKIDLLPAAEQKVTAAITVYNDEVLVLQDRGEILDQLAIDLEDKQDALAAATTQLNIKEQQRADVESALNQPGLTPEEIATLQTQLALVNAQIANLNVQIAQLNNELSDISVRISELNDPQKLVKKVNGLTEKLLTVTNERDKIKYEISYLEITKAAKEKRLTEYDATIDDIDARDIWCIDYEITLEPTANSPIENKYVSIEINDDHTHILMAPRTYTPTIEDTQEALDAILAKQEEYDALDAEYIKIQADLVGANAKIDEKNDQINAERNYITTLPPGLSEAERSLLILESNERLRKMEQELQDLVANALKLAEKSKALEAKKGLAAQIIVRLTDYYNDLLAAMQSPSGILVPEIDEYTKQLQPTQSSGASAVFYNKSLLPGYQKWLPTFRIGTIKAITDDTCTVELDEAISSQQKLNINQAPILTDVPIRYGNCNGAVFAVGDNIVVEFKSRDQTKPVVIGFQDHPKPCGGVVCIPSSDLAPNGWGYPLKDNAGELINPPLGTVGGTRNQYVFSFSAPPSSAPHISRNIEPALGGNCHSNGNPFVSWHGPFGFNIAPDVKYFINAEVADLPGYETQIIDLGIVQAANVNVAVYNRFSPNIYQNKKLRATASGDVLGAGFYGGILVCVVAGTRLRDDIYYLNQNDVWTQVGSVTFIDGLNGTIMPRHHSYWFSSDGSKITSLIASIEVSETGPRIAEYANIPEIILSKNQSGDISLVSTTTSSIFNHFELTETIASTFSGTIGPPYPANSFYNSQRNVFVDGNNEIILGIGYKGNQIKKIKGQLIYLLSVTVNNSFFRQSEILQNGSGTMLDNVAITSGYYLDNVLLFQADYATHYSANVAYDNISNTVHQNEISSNNTENYISLLYFNIDNDFYVYKKINKTKAETETNSSDTITWDKNYSINESIDVFSKNNLAPENIFTQADTGNSSATEDPILRIPNGIVENIEKYISSKEPDHFGQPGDLMTGAVDFYGNGVFQYRANPKGFMIDPVDAAILPGNHTIQTLTGALGDNPKLANLDNLFQPDTIMTDGIIFRA